MHLESTCTGLTNTAINGIKDLGLNAMLLCDTCVTNNERDNFIKCRTMMQMNEKIEKESEGIQARLENMEKRLTALVDEKVENATKTTCEKLEKSYADVLSVKPVKDVKAQPGAGKEVKQEIHHNINKSFRIQGIREDPEKSKGENFVLTTEKVHEVLKKLGVKPQIEEIKRLGKFSKERIKSRTLLITLSTEHEARLVLAKSFEKRDELRDEEIYLLPASSKEDARKENLCLKRRRELLDEGVPKEKIKIRNFELFNDGKRDDRSRTSR